MTKINTGIDIPEEEEKALVKAMITKMIEDEYFYKIDDGIYLTSKGFRWLAENSVKKPT